MSAVVEGFMLSPQQTRLWRLQKSGPAAVFRTCCLLRCTAPLDSDLLREALRETVRRNEILRTVFQQVPGMELPLQVIADEREPSLEWTGLPAGTGERIESLLRDVDSADEGGLRGRLIDGPDGQQLLLDLHALRADTAGLVNLAGEVEACYQALLRGGRPETAPLQYADVASWLNELLESQDPRARRYWQAKDFSHDLAAALPFPRRDGNGGFDPRQLDLPVPVDIAGRLLDLARDLGRAVPDLVLTAWSLLLLRLTGRSTVVVGTAFDGRRHEELKEALGLFARYLPVSFAAAPGTSFAEAARDLAGTLAEQAEWQEFFVWNGEGPTGEPPFFPFGFESVRLGGGGLLVMERCHACIDRFELKLAWVETPDGFRAELHYDATVLCQKDVARVGEWFLQLLGSGAGHPGATAGELEILTAEDREQWGELNDTAFDFGPAKTLAQRFEEQADRTPDRVAVTFRDRTLTYAELEERSNRLARLLRRMEVGPDRRVALCVERSLEMVVGILGILKAGGAYVPVDTSYPEVRRSFMLADASSPVVITEERWAAAIPAGPQVLRLDLDGSRIEAEDSRRLPSAAGPDDLAYVIYTSGSTGQPKGVMISHRAISNRLLWHQRAFPLAADDRLLQKTPYSFDASVWEIFLPLMTGARLVMAEPGGHQDTAYLADAVARHGVTVLQLVPSVLAALLEEPRLAERCRPLRRLFCGGEAYPAELAQRCRGLLPGVAICNLYGPTEVSIDASFHAGPAAGEPVLPIGRPLDNAGLHLLDASGRRVPPGLAGELYVSGPGLARGYLGRPELTAERFVPSAFGAAPGERLYRTGDRARLAPGGEVHFLGRIDQQVKIRGFRIEPGEIEAALQQHPAVRGAAVVVWQEGGDPRLAAYAVPARETDLDPGELREFLAARLPEHMVPADLVILDELPRLPNGKVDRGGAARSRLGADRLRPPPRGAAHPRRGNPRRHLGRGAAGRPRRRLRRLLPAGGPLPGRHAGDLPRRARRSGVDLPVRGTVRGADRGRLGRGGRAHAQGGGRPAAATDRTGLARSQPATLLLPAAALVPAAAGAREPGLQHPGRPAPDRPTGPPGLGAKPRRDPPASRGAAHDLLARGRRAGTGHPPLARAGAAGRGPGGARAGGSRARGPRDPPREAGRPFDLATGPLLRAHLLCLDEREHVVFFNLHHIVSDGWSVGILVRELSALYAAHATGKAAVTPRFPFSTPTSPGGSGGGCRVPCWNPRSRTGGSGWRERPRC